MSYNCQEETVFEAINVSDLSILAKSSMEMGY